ncbi:MAG: hypothetical protein ACOC56_02325 [Atribacterota bacterium]
MTEKSEDDIKEKIKNDASEIRKKRIKEIPKNEIEEHLRNGYIERERNYDERKTAFNDSLRKCYYEIKEVLEYYVDMKEEYYSLIACWIIGTYFHEYLSTYPYLFLNAMKGSAKSRTLRLIIELSKNGVMMAAPTEAVLFRTTGTLGIDEFENLGKKEKSTIKELLNASYKKGIKIFRMRKKKTIEGEQQIVESFEPYRPIAIANIAGIEEVLESRCISLILEKSDCPVRTKLIEDYENDENIKNIKNIAEKCRVCSVESLKNLRKSWNKYIIDKHNYTYYTNSTHTTHYTHSTLEGIKIDKLFNKIDETEIYARDLELFLPLFFISYNLDESIFEDILKISKEMVDEKEKSERTESKDIMLIDFIAQKEEGFYHTRVKELVREFKEFIDYEPIRDDDWLNTSWFGAALKRLSLIIDKRRSGRGVEVILNTAKAKQKLMMFKK